MSDSCFHFARGLEVRFSFVQGVGTGQRCGCECYADNSFCSLVKCSRRTAGLFIGCIYIQELCFKVHVEVYFSR
jgi:hypothetical protein